MTELLLGIDIGTASAKGVLVTPDGTVLARATRPHTLSVPRPGWAEHDVEAVWWEGVRELCTALLSGPDVRSRVAGVCVSGIGPCVALCDAALEPLGPAILYGIDVRASAEVEELTARFGAAEILARCGSELSSQALGPKLLWLRRHAPEAWERAAGWYMASSFAVARLTGEYVLDHHSASQCDPLYDLAARDWAADWAHGVAPGVPLPRLAWPGERVGTVHEAGASATGIPVGTPVMAGTIDAWAEAFSVGVRRPGDLMLMYGSTMFLVDVLDPAIAAPRSGLWTTAGVDPGGVTYAAGMATSGSLTEWLRQLTGDVSFDTLAREAAGVPAGARGLVLLPYFAGERSPIFDPAARGVIAGLTLAHGRAELFRAIYEAIGYGVRHILETFPAAGERRVVAVGGGTTDQLWAQIVSDIIGIEQEITTEKVGACYGDALLAAIGAGVVTPETDWASVAETVVPAPGAPTVYDELYALYRELHEATAGVQHRLAALQDG